MKKVLFATTALVGSAGVAAADVAISGFAEMGVIGGNTAAFGPVFDRVQFHTDIDVTFTMSGETDHGVTFGASVDLDESFPNTFNNTTEGGESIFVSGAFGTLTMGDTDGALDWALSEAAIGGDSINDDHTTHGGYSGNGGMDGFNDGQIARYDYTFGDFSVGLSAEVDDSGGPAVAAGGRLGGTGSTIYGIGAKYSLAMSGATLDLGAGAQFTWNAAIYGASIKLEMDNGLGAVVNGKIWDSSNPRVADGYNVGAGLAYTYDALTISGNWGGFFLTGAGNDNNGWGAQASYDLGGGMELQAGFGSGNRSGTQYSLGAAMSF